ncbi:MAG: glutathione-disulfide reductase [Alphaproteobacteria bacterium]
MSTHPYDFDYFVIGAGSGGVRSARIAASLGAKVGIAEYKAVGGTCVNVGCVPKKIMAYAADYSAHFEDARGYGWEGGAPEGFDWAGFIAKKNAEIERLNGIYSTLLENAGVTYFNGQASFIDPHRLEIGADKATVSADKILIATGGTPRKDTISGAEHLLTSDEIFYLPRQPEHILIHGGGYVAVEFAHIFKGLGSKVTLVYRGDLFLRGFDDDLRLHLKTEMEKQGIALIFETALTAIEKTAQDRYTATLSNGTTLETNCILSAIGRIPNTAGLGLEAAGINTAPNGQIIINEHYQSSAPHIFALGDVANQFHLTPVATAEGQALAHHLFGHENEKKNKIVSYQNIATAVFSNPPIATVGLSEKQARENGFEIDIFKTTFRPMKFILAARDEKILMKLVVCRKTDRVLGCHMIGLDAPEIMQGFAVALNAGATKADFDRTIGIHPTAAEEFVTLRTAAR